MAAHSSSESIALILYFDGLRRIVQHLRPWRPFREVLQDVLATLASELHFLRPHIVVQNPEDGNLHLSLAHDLPPAGHYDYRPGSGITGQVFASGKAIIVPRMKDHPDFQNRLFARSPEQLAGLSFLCVPVIAQTTPDTGQRQTKPGIIGTLSADLPLLPSDELTLRCRFLELVAAMLSHQIACLQEELLHQARHCTRMDARPLPAALRTMPAIVAVSTAMNHVLHHVAQVAPSQTTILLRGESGTGKELIAKAIHHCSTRATNPLVRLNCAALPADLAEGELFGWQKGAFTGATQGRRGVFEQADTGTLFLDEIGDLPLPLQAKLLRAIQEREISRLGSEQPRQVDVRLICATHQPLEQLVREGRFREDLYYRINVFPLVLPPLRERREDILPLATHFLHALARSYGNSPQQLSPQAADLLMAHDWPGNVRELQNVLERAALLAAGDTIRREHLPQELRHADPKLPRRATATVPRSFQEHVAALEKHLLTKALVAAEGNIHQAARDSGLTCRVFSYKMKKYGLEPRLVAKTSGNRK